MKTCLKCNKEFPLRTFIGGKLRNLQKRKFCLKCSPFGEHNTSDCRKDPSKHTCPKCKENLPRTAFYKKGETINSYCKPCQDKTTKERKFKVKNLAVDFKGGKCQCCGYKAFIGALEFHHLDPSIKDFEISEKLRTGNCFENLQKELEKCILLCANCHREIHGKVRILNEN